MKKTAITLTTILALAAGTAQSDQSGFYLSMGLGQTLVADEAWTERVTTDGLDFTLQARYHWKPQTWCFNCQPTIQWLHLSEVERGCPQDCGQRETMVDNFSFNLEWRIGR